MDDYESEEDFEEGSGILKAPYADIISALVYECPYCGRDGTIEGCSQGDITGWDFEEESTETCIHCGKEFSYNVQD